MKLRLFGLALLLPLNVLAGALGPQPDTCGAIVPSCSPHPCWTRTTSQGTYSPKQINSLPINFSLPPDACIPYFNGLRNIQLPAPIINVFSFTPGSTSPDQGGGIQAYPIKSQEDARGFSVKKPLTQIPGTVEFYYTKWITNPVPDCSNPFFPFDIKPVGSQITSFVTDTAIPPGPACAPVTSTCVDSQGFNPTPGTYPACQNGCQFTTADAGVVNLAPTASVTLYSTATSSNCAAQRQLRTCNGGNGATNTSGTLSGSAAYAYKNCTIPVVNGLCGGANSKSYADISSVIAGGLCTTGAASSITGAGPWNWACNGSGGGSNASCSATTAAVQGVCWMSGRNGEAPSPTNPVRWTSVNSGPVSQTRSCQPANMNAGTCVGLLADCYFNFGNQTVWATTCYQAKIKSTGSIVAVGPTVCDELQNDYFNAGANSPGQYTNPSPDPSKCVATTCTPPPPGYCLCKESATDGGCTANPSFVTHHLGSLAFPVSGQTGWVPLTAANCSSFTASTGDCGCHYSPTLDPPYKE